MSKSFRNVIVGLLTVSGIVVGVSLENVCLLLDTFKAGLIYGGGAFIVSWFLFFVYHFASFSFISRIDIKVTKSVDNGENYSDNIYSITKGKGIFLKCEISAGANFPRYPFLGKVKCFNISMVEDKVKNNLEPCDYSGIFGKAEDKKKDKNGDNYLTSYKINALANRNKVNIIFKLPYDKSKDEKPYKLKIEFRRRVLKVFDRTIVLCGKWKFPEAGAQ